MKTLPYLPLRRSQAGVALLISIFVLMLISVIALSLILASGTETALAGNYRSSSSVYYAALAGLEEGRGRLLPRNPNPLPVPAPFPLNQVLYILNPAPGENVTPTAPAGSAGYPDTEYSKEFPAGLGGATVSFQSSVSPVAGLPPAMYKWVRINAVTEKSLNLDVDSKHSPSTLDSSTAIYYDSQDANCNPLARLSLTVGSCPSSSTATQALEITSLAALPDGSQKLMQYVVAPVSSGNPPSLPMNFVPPGSAGQTFPAALTLLGNNVRFQGPTDPNSSFGISGNDQCGSASTVSAIGYTNPQDLQQIESGTSPNQSSYPGAGKATPSVLNVAGLPPSLQTPSGLDALVQTITQGADKVLTGPANETMLPKTMSSGNPMTVVVNGDFDLGSGHSGFGLLVITGTFTYDADTSWDGIILVIGKGQVVASKIGNMTGKFNGAILIAQTRDLSTGALLPDPNLGSASYSNQNSGDSGGWGIYYNTCSIKTAQEAVRNGIPYKILSYRQLSQ
jgi:hypothetical protein